MSETVRPNMVGLNCSSLEQDDFQARYQYVDLGKIRLTDIVAKQHVVERTPALVRAREKDSIFLIMQLRGTAFINRANECVVLKEGDCVVYDTDRPYMHGFPGFMRHVIIDAPGEEFRLRFPGWSLKEAVRYDSSIGQGRSIATAFRQILSQHHPFKAVDGVDRGFEIDVWEILRAAYTLSQGSKRSIYHALMVERIKKFIKANLRDPDLAPPVIANEIGISVRQLNRLFSTEPHTVGATIMSMRLDQCRTDLLRRSTVGSTVSEIAYHWGFRSTAHFSRRFREAFGYAPSEIHGQS